MAQNEIKANYIKKSIISKSLFRSFKDWIGQLIIHYLLIDFCCLSSCSTRFLGESLA